jgi:dipeptidyl aminopeptidase/acylaminoacyl peptidase
MKHKIFIISSILLLSSFVSFAQGTVEDYKRAYAVAKTFSSENVYYSNVRPVWIKKSDLFWYVRNTPQGRVYMVIDANKKTKVPLFDHEDLAASLTKASGKEVLANAMILERLQVNPTADTLRFNFGRQKWVYLLKKNQLVDDGKISTPPRVPHWTVVDEEKDGDPVISPNGKFSAFVKDNNIFIKEIATGQEKQVSTDGTAGNYYSSYITWAPDSKKLAANKIRPVEKRFIYYVESSPESQLQPILHELEYAKPGDELRFKVPCVFNIENGTSYAVPAQSISPQYEIGNLEWNKTGTAVLFDFNQRGHQRYCIYELSAETGKLRHIIEETSKTFVNYTRYFRQNLKNGNEIIWMSERDNWNHLYLYDVQTASVKNQITKGEWYVRNVIHVDEDSRTIWFTANGMVPDEDPYLVRYYRIDFDGKNLICLTPEEGNHQAWFSEGMKFLVDVYSMVDKAPVAVLRNASDGRIIMELEKADISRLLENGWKAPEVFTAKGRDGTTDIWGIIIRPVNFDPSRKYPVIEYIYSGPGSHYVPKSFISYNRNMTSLAELGFIVVQIDGMGTSFRSKAFEEVCFRNLADSGFPDRKLWIKAVAEKYPYMDIDRVGIFGASAGGQESTTAVLLHPEFYKAAYSSCGCHDNRMDKIWWNEQWLGYPVGEQYVAGSNVENAHLLERPLMLVVGEMDDNVDPASTMQVVDALIKANKDFELVVLPGVRHTMGESYGEHKRYDFFVRHLLHVDPPKWQELE